MPSTLGIVSSAASISAAAPIFTDNFNRADGVLGGNWTQFDQALNISGNKVIDTAVNNGCGAAYTAAAFTADQWAEGFVSVVSGVDGCIGPGVRISGTSRDFQYYGWLNSTGGVKITKRSGGFTYTDIASGAFAGLSGTMAISVAGSTISLYMNGVLACSVVDATIASGNPGLIGYQAAAGAVSFDNFRCGSGVYPGMAAALVLTPLVRFQSAAFGAITMIINSGAVVNAVAGSYLVIGLMNDALNDSGGSTGVTTVAVTDNIGDTGGGAWTKQANCSRGSVPVTNYLEDTWIYTRLIGTSPGANKTVTVTFQRPGGFSNSGDGWVWADLVQVIGQGASPIGLSTGNTTRQAAGPTTMNMVLGGTPVATSIVYSLIHGDNTTLVPTNPAGFTTVTNDPNGNGAVMRSAYQNGSVIATPQWTALATGSNWLGCALEIKA